MAALISFCLSPWIEEGAVNSIVGRRTAKGQQMRWPVPGAHMLTQVRTGDVNGEPRDRLRVDFRKHAPWSPWRSAPSHSSGARRDPEKLPLSTSVKLQPR